MKNHFPQEIPDLGPPFGFTEEEIAAADAELVRVKSLLKSYLVPHQFAAKLSLTESPKTIRIVLDVSSDIPDDEIASLKCPYEIVCNRS